MSDRNNDTKKLIILIATIWVVCHFVAHISVKKVKSNITTERDPKTQVQTQIQVDDSLSQDSIIYQQALDAYNKLTDDQKKMMNKQIEYERQ